MTLDNNDHVDIPIAKCDEGWEVWGVPVSIEWWKNQDEVTVESLVSYRNENNDIGKLCFAAHVSAAVEEVSVWIESGVEVVDRTWVDVGGASGYYAIALKLLGASKVTLVDVEPLPKYAVPVLKNFNIDCICSDGGDMCFKDVDSIVALYLPTLELSDVFSNYPNLVQAVVSDGFYDDMFLELSHWKRNIFNEKAMFFQRGCGVVTRSYKGARSLDYEWYSGDVIINSGYILKKIEEEKWVQQKGAVRYVTESTKLEDIELSSVLNSKLADVPF